MFVGAGHGPTPAGKAHPVLTPCTSSTVASTRWHGTVVPPPDTATAPVNGVVPESAICQFSDGAAAEASAALSYAEALLSPAKVAIWAPDAAEGESDTMESVPPKNPMVGASDQPVEASGPHPIDG